MKSPTPTSLTLKTPCKTLEKTEAREDNLIKNYATNNLVQPSRCQPCCPVSAILPSPSSAERPGKSEFTLYYPTPSSQIGKCASE